MNGLKLKKITLSSAATLAIAFQLLTPSASLAGLDMNAVRLNGDLSCPLFENKPHAELINAIDALSKEVRTTSQCSDDPSIKSLQDNGKSLKENVGSLQKIMETNDATQVSTTQIDQTTTFALQAVKNIGEVLNSKTFLSSKCGRQAMSSGKALLALNEVINGLTPYALFAISMNAALAPALPYVIGGAVATSGISALSKMIDSNTLDMKNPDHREAVLQNTCQFVNVAKKVRFMQLAQSGKIDKLTQELEQDMSKYRGQFGKPSKELSSLLAYKGTVTANLAQREAQLAKDKADLATVDGQIGSNNDDLMTCTIAQELVKWSQDGKSFPASSFINLSSSVAQGNKSQQLQALTMFTLNQASLKHLRELAPHIATQESSMKECAQAGRSWILGIRQSISATASIIQQNKAALENELSENAEYRSWKAQYSNIQTQQVTIKRVQQALQDLSKDTSVIDRSELDQRMVLLKAGLFGSRSFWNFGKPPVLAWIEHTRQKHQEAISSFESGLSVLKSGAWSLTKSGTGKSTVVTTSGSMYVDAKKQAQDIKAMKSLESINLKTLPVGSAGNKLACEQLESTWIDWGSAMNHLGAIQFFCDMIDSVLDIKIDTAVYVACRGNMKLNGEVISESLVSQAKKILTAKGFQSDAALVGRKLTELQCPLPAVSVMNQK